MLHRSGALSRLPHCVSRAVVVAAAPAPGAGWVAAGPRVGGGREDPVLLAACPSLAVAIWGSMFI